MTQTGMVLTHFGLKTGIDCHYSAQKLGMVLPCAFVVEKYD